MLVNRYYYLIIFIFTTSILSGQQIVFYGYEMGTLLPVDSVIFGFHPNATVGIDIELKEVDISNDSIGEFELRVIQKDMNDHECLYDMDNNPIFYLESFESKVNLRPVINDEIYRHFEVVNLTNNYFGGYEIYLRNYLDGNDVNENYLGFYPTVDCLTSNLLYEDLLENIPIQGFESIVVTPTSWDNVEDPYQRFYFYLQVDTNLVSSTLNHSEQIEKITLYPNPTSDVVRIQSEGRIESWEVFSNTWQFIGGGNTKSINVSNYVNGLYYLKIYDGSKHSIHKMIKIE